jgi:hypothetical protein
MLPFIASRQTKVVICVSCSRSRDGSHEHVAKLMVRSQTGRDQRLSVSDAVAQLRHPSGERYMARSPGAGEHAELVAGSCPVCHESPYVRLSRGRIEDLPRCH